MPKKINFSRFLDTETYVYISSSYTVKILETVLTLLIPLNDILLIFAISMTSTWGFIWSRSQLPKASLDLRSVWEAFSFTEHLV